MPQTIRMGLIKRRSDLSVEGFRTHWQGPHGTLASAMPGLRSYHQNHVVRSAELVGLTDPWSLDGLSQLAFDSLAAMQASVRSPAYAPLANDTPQLMTMPGIIAGEPRLRLGENETPARKIMLVATLLQHADPSWNSLAWAAGLRGLRAAFDIPVTHRESEPAIEVTRDRLPVDLIAQLWFDTPQSADHALAHLAGETAYLRQFVSAGGLYLTQTHVVVAGEKEA